MSWWTWKTRNLQSQGSPKIITLLLLTSPGATRPNRPTISTRKMCQIDWLKIRSAAKGEHQSRETPLIVTWWQTPWKCKWIKPLWRPMPTFITMGIELIVMRARRPLSQTSRKPFQTKTWSKKRQMWQVSSQRRVQGFFKRTQRFKRRPSNSSSYKACSRKKYRRKWKSKWDMARILICEIFLRSAKHQNKTVISCSTMRRVQRPWWLQVPPPSHFQSSNQKQEA